MALFCLGSSRYAATFNASASVRNEVTDSSLVQFMYELERLRKEPVEQEELDLAKSSLKVHLPDHWKEQVLLHHSQEAQ